MARVILDTNNVLEATEALPTDISGTSLQEFVELLTASRRYPEGFLLVCDGEPWEDAPKTLPSGIQLTFSGHEVIADDVIARVVSQSSISRQLLVITTDRALQRQVKRLKASTMDSKAFLEELGRDWSNLPTQPTPPEGSPKSFPQSVLPPDLVTEAEAIRSVKSDIPQHLLGKMQEKAPKNQDSDRTPPADPPPDTPPDTPPDCGFSFDPDTLEDAERIAKGHPPHDP